MLIATFAVLPLQAAFYSWMSRLNQFFFFGRTAPDVVKSSAEARSLVRRYLLRIWLGCALAALVGVLLWRQHNAACLLWAVLVEALAFNVAFARAHREAGRLMPAAQPRAAVEVPLTAPQGGVPSLAALLAPIAFTVAVAAVSLVVAARGSSLRAAPQALDALVEAHGGDRIFSFGLGLATAGLLALLIRVRARTRTPLAKNALRSSMIATWAGALLMTAAIMVAFAGGAISPAENQAILFVVLGAAAAVIVFRTVVNRRFVPPPAEMQGDENWRWGLFYCNRNDPALFVQSRCGAGFTLNFGRATAWPLSALFVGSLVAVLVAVSNR